MDWIAGLFELIGLYIVGTKSRIGFLFNFIGNVIWIIVACSTEVYGLLLVVIPAVFINLWNWWKWKYENK